MRVAGAVDIGGTRTKIGIVGENGRVLEKKAVTTPRGGEPEPLVASIAATLQQLLKGAPRHGDLQPTIGVSVAGFLNPSRTTMYGNANLPRLSDFPLKRALEDRLDRPCVLEVDSNAAVLAEYRQGAGRGSRRLLGITVGTGIGGGVIIDGELLRYNGECAGDLGHVVVATEGKDLRLCTCGARGCLEAMACSRALAQRAGGRSVHAIVRAARGGDRRALNALSRTARWLGVGLASLAPVFAPDTIVVGGGVGTAGDLLLAPARASFREHAGSDFRDAVRVVASELEGWDGLIGAACLVLA
jgi:glucokinase